ncbi:hypothetical protein B0H12DRAFT_1236935 [Mycena haematopus]|nr:hypothetical protein B0H12DRAFT_1236935 [Mycena haematopus]
MPPTLAIDLPQPAAATIGPLLLGVVLHFALFGFMLSVTARYFAQFGGGVYGYLVGALLILNVVEAVINIDVVYRVTVTHFGDGVVLGDQSWTLWIEPTIVSLIGALAHAFFLERCWRATDKSTIAVGVLGFCALLSLGSGLAVSATAAHSTTATVFISGKPSTSIAMSVWLVATAATDLALCALLVVSAMCFNAKSSSSSSVAFKQQRHREGRSVLEKIVALWVRTGGVSMVVAVLNLVLYFAKDGTADHVLAQYALGPIYTLTAVQVLLARRVPDSAVATAASFPLGTRDKLKVNVHTAVETDMPDGSPDADTTDTGSAKVTWGGAV